MMFTGISKDGDEGGVDGGGEGRGDGDDGGGGDGGGGEGGGGVGPAKATKTMEGVVKLVTLTLSAMESSVIVVVLSKATASMAAATVGMIICRSTCTDAAERLRFTSLTDVRLRRENRLAFRAAPSKDVRSPAAFMLIVITGL